MQLTDFEQRLDAKIVQRGKTYYKQSHVRNLEQISETNWQAEVEGTSLYVVDIVIEEDSYVTYVDCDCPYEDTCKHIVATLYKIKEQSQQPAIKKVTKPALKGLLKEQSKEQLIELILTIGKKHPDFLRELELELLPVENELELAEKIIQQHLKAAQDRHGFIQWSKTEIAVTGIERIHKRSEQHLDEENYDVALELAGLCLRYSLEALEYGDDSNGDFSGNAEYSVDLVHRIIECNDWDAARKKHVFCMVEDMIFSEGLEQWESWQLDLLAACIPLCDNSACEHQFMTIAKLLEGKYRSKAYSDYMIERIHKLKQRLKTTYMTNEEAEQFLQQHPTEHALRKRLIETALEKQYYEKVMYLAEQGMQADERENLQWKEYAFTAQKAQNNKPQMMKLATDLLLMNQAEYYDQLQALYSSEEWQEQREILLDALERKNSYLYSQFIIKEQQTARILAYCQHNPHTITDYYSHLVGIYDEQVIELFTTAITKVAQAANSRSQYKVVAQMITKMQLAGYQNEVRSILEGLRFQYYRRSAFMDELKKI